MKNYTIGSRTNSVSVTSLSSLKVTGRSSQSRLAGLLQFRVHAPLASRRQAAVLLDNVNNFDFWTAQVSGTFPENSVNFRCCLLFDFGKMVQVGRNVSPRRLVQICLKYSETSSFAFALCPFCRSRTGRFKSSQYHNALRTFYLTLYAELETFWRRSESVCI